MTGCIVCKTCDQVIAHYESEKVAKLYAACCDHCQNETNSN
ncbi:GapA-binding peptide SR1P [Texcoconibacillus texcoconensis]|uniref:GapA-binding peptide SR1P n=1 Tax=Texcoconibacillus texcoconensis TaxID=1095777 RepID=A0A840QLI5_9BACI|nr:GapA-binding peptide SR1P [Texcoconibacillus texcoconensis]MBB5172232.1 hypothetical protein [Texcoconibacillus texcoconensis]